MPIAASTASAPKNLAGQKIRVMIVDDSAVVRGLISRWLGEASDIEVVSVQRNGKAAVNAIESADPDVVILDVEMPEMDGLTATRKIREELGFRDLPVIAMTAHALAEERERCRAAGMVAHISKPFEAAELISTINRFAAASAQPGLRERAANDGNRDGEASLDLEEVSARLMLPRETVVRLLTKFGGDYGDCPARLVNLLDREDWEEARRLMHSLKGAASSLGLAAITELAGEVEGRVSSDTEPVGAEVLDRFRTVHAQTMSAIERELPLDPA